MKRLEIRRHTGLRDTKRGEGTIINNLPWSSSTELGALFGYLPA